MEQNEEKKGNILLGILGALIGGAIGTLPWVLCYVYGGMMLSALAIVIAIASFKGYELFKGKIDKKVPYIIGIVSVLAVTVATFYVIPHLLIIKERGQTSMALFKYLYSLNDFKAGIIEDYIYSLLFTIVGTSGVLASIKRSIEAGDEKVDFSKPVYSPSNDDIDDVKEVFVKNGAMDKNHTIGKTELMESIKGNEGVLNFLIARGIVVRKKNQYYYNLEIEQNPRKRTLKILAITMGVTFGIIILSIVLGIILS